MKVYLSGRITGDKNYREKFNLAAQKLIASNHAVFNPAILPDGFDYEDYMKIDFCALSACDAIFLLEDWLASPGAIREKEEAERLGLKILTKDDLRVAADERKSA